ncbi:hypothetical protein E4T50_12731 [Aureobasidium sp. EXF-12298]|nr:hypothetical protein E4T50_12731 [Aureobasidium sp. EXF-12298]KAI4754407.1 hypothetical protein E4T51_12500 [Aureobasidium sp. EXF-12344]KAI4781012.1 hypothetical protein E4T52_04046 [Aureobasidium sp. EXF-3400]
MTAANGTPTLHELKSYDMLAISAVFLALSAITVIARIYVRGWMIRSFGWDDWLMMVTWALFAVTTSLLIAIARLEIVPPGVADQDTVNYILTLVVCIFGLYILTTIIFKLSLAIFFLRVVNQRWQRQVIIGSVTLYTLFGTAWLFVAIFQCGSPADYGKNEALGKCLPFRTVLRPLNYTHGVLNAVTDWIFAIIPIFVVRAAQMHRQQKITVCTILGLGVLGSICSLVRLAYVDVIGVALQDLLISAPNYGIVSIVELGLGITAACLATLRPLFAFWFDKARTGFTSSRSRTPRSTPMGLDGSKGVSGSYITSGHNMSPKDDGFVTVTRELQIFSNRPSTTGETMEMHAMGPTAHRSRSQSSEESLLEVV